MFWRSNKEFILKNNIKRKHIRFATLQKYLRNNADGFSFYVNLLFGEVIKYSRLQKNTITSSSIFLNSMSRKNPLVACDAAPRPAQPREVLRGAIVISTHQNALTWRSAYGASLGSLMFYSQPIIEAAIIKARFRFSVICLNLRDIFRCLRLRQTIRRLSKCRLFAYIH